MLRRSLLTLTLVLLLAAGFVFGIARLFVLRYEGGEVYPPYSTLRPDPLGAKALYEALDALPGVEVRRNFQPLKKLQPGKPVTLAYLGTARESFWTERELQELETLLLNGTRVIIAFFPLDRAPIPGVSRQEEERSRKEKYERVEKEKAREDSEEEKRDGEKSPGEKRIDRESGLVSFTTFGKRYGFQFDYLPPEEDKTYHRHAFLFQPGVALERDLTWHSALYFSELAPEWKPLYLSETRPVLIERAYGRGSLVLAADTFFLSNEALRNERHSQLIARIFGGPPAIIFDEEHLGVTNQPGLVQLAVKYKLHGVMAGLVLIAALFVWKNAMRFIPPYAAAERDDAAVAGRDAALGFENLLYRAVRPIDLLPVCVDEWRRGQNHPDSAIAIVEEICAAEHSLPPRQRDPVTSYREIAQRLARKSRITQS
jgi:hypothetical protein